MPVHYGKLVSPTSGVSLDPDARASFTPTVSPTAGAITSYTATADYEQVGKLVTVSFTVNVTDNGTGSGAVKVSGFPFAASGRMHVGSAVNATSAKICVAYMPSGTTDVYVRLYDSTYPVATGESIDGTITYLAA